MTSLGLLVGGLGLFLLGMSMMTDGLKLAAGSALDRILSAATRTRWHALGSGALIGFVNAGLLSLAPAALRRFICVGASRNPIDWSRTVSKWSWILVTLGMIAAVIAVQFDEPWLEVGGAATFVLLFAWVVVAMRQRVRVVPR